MPHVRVSDKVKQHLDKIATRDGRSIDRIIEEALVLYLGMFKEKRNPLPSNRGRPTKKEKDNDKSS